MNTMYIYIIDIYINTIYSIFTDRWEFYKH